MVYILPVLAILIGYVLVKFIIKSENLIAYLLSFSGAFLLSVTLFEMVPELFEKPKRTYGVFIMLGILLQIIMEYFSKGAEHGHVHIHNNKNRFPLLLFLSLSLHALIEGVPITENHNMLWGVFVHKIPIAAMLTLYFIKAGVSQLQMLIFLLLFSFMTPLGSIITLNTEVLNEVLPYINAIAIGVFLHVATTILFESSKNHTFNLTKLITIILGTLIAYFI
ncbi:MAG: ZIP family metal transporter [Alteromonas sp.]|nr:ZIP family metal transporter [Alteromonas sp.]MAY21445.1 ZIP family metal transporter [Flavobacteriaceae bacterium]|tara:strand:- start:1124 stop:1789 length:666 start_codon:yes stop_codon:yes gene_type:complete